MVSRRYDNAPSTKVVTEGTRIDAHPHPHPRQGDAELQRVYDKKQTNATGTTHVPSSLSKSAPSSSVMLHSNEHGKANANANVTTNTNTHTSTNTVVNANTIANDYSRGGDKDMNNSDRDRDPIGTHMARLLNEGAFERVSVPTSTSTTCPKFFPLVSEANVHRSKNVIQAIVKTFFQQPQQGKRMESWWECAKSIIQALLFGVLLLTSGTSIVLTFLLRWYLFGIVFLVTLFFDVNYLFHNACPKIVSRGIHWVIRFVKAIDRKCLFADRVHGRNCFQWERERERNWGQKKTMLRDRIVPQSLRRFRNRDKRVDWNGMKQTLRRSHAEGSTLHGKTVDHLMAMNFSYVMACDYADPKDVQKKKNKKLSSSNKNTRTSRKVHLEIDESTTGIDIHREVRLDRGLDLGDALNTSDGIEMVDAIAPRMIRPVMKRQKSSQHRANLYSYDETEDVANHKFFSSDDEDEFGSPRRPRVCSETDVDFYDQEITGGGPETDADADAKNKKWLDVGAKIGMRILKSEQVKDFIGQTTTLSADNVDSLYEDLTMDESRDNNEDFELPSPQIPKPFHEMWQTEGNQLFDNELEGYMSTDSEVSVSQKKRKHPLSPAISASALRQTISLSPRRGRGGTLYISSSVPSSPRPSLPKLHKQIDTCHESEGNVSVTSSEAIQWVPRQFDANRHLPASMAINHGDLPNSRSHRVRMITPEEYRMKQSVITRPRNHRQRELLLPGVKIVVPLFPLVSTTKSSRNSLEGRVPQLATVVSSKRIAIASSGHESESTDALSITVLLDKSFLRNGRFVKMTFRILDSNRQFPRHSKFPIGKPIATSFGVGILVGWRLKDDCHILRALWQKRGQGSSKAYLNRNSLHCVLEASIGFKVETNHGPGKVVGYVNVGKGFYDGEFLVQVKKEGRNDNRQIFVKRSDILSCTSANFIPVVEQLKEAAKYQMQVDNYETEKLQLLLQEDRTLITKSWLEFSQSFELFLSSFIKAAEEDENFDSEINNYLSQIIAFLEDLELGGTKKRQQPPTEDADSDKSSGQITASALDALVTKPEYEAKHVDKSTMQTEVTDVPGMWFFRDLFGNTNKNDVSDIDDGEISKIENHTTRPFGEESYKKVYAVFTILMRTVSIAQAGCTDKPNLKMALAILHEALLFCHNVIKVQQVNMTEASIIGWKETLDQLGTLFGPMNARVKKVLKGIVQRLEDHGKVAKMRALSFAELLVVDDKLIESLEAGDSADCIIRVEDAAVSAGIINEDARAHYHKLATLFLSTLVPRANKESEAATRNGQKFTFLAKTIKVIATPANSALSLLTNDDILDTIERVLVRVFDKEKDASQIINIYSWTFRTFRHLRILNNLAIVGNLWAPILNAADEEFIWAVSRTPENTQQYVKPISKLFTLGVARFHELHKSDSKVSADWLDFLKEDEAIRIIQDLDGALLLFMKNFCKDMEDMMYILPYYSSIDDDILNLIDKVDLEEELKEIAEALADKDKFPMYMREKSAKAVTVFLDYLPKMSIPIEKREVGEGWVMTCRGRNGNDMTLSNVKIEKDNLICRVLGGQNVLGLEDIELLKKPSMSSLMKDSALSIDEDGNIEVSILDHVAELIRNAQNHGCWNVDSGYFVSASPLDGLPLSELLHCAIELWENLQLDDDELLEIAIREISSQIQKHKVKDDSNDAHLNEDMNWPEESRRIQKMHQDYVRKGVSIDDEIRQDLSTESNLSTAGRHFNPRKDPTVLYLAMDHLTCCLDDFTYRLEPSKSNSIFDPVFEGVGSLVVKNASIKIRIECRKERIRKLGEDVTVPVLQLQQLDVGLEKVQFAFKQTGVDWMLNKIVSNFYDKITQLVRENLKEQICLSINNTIETVNKYIEVNPDLMLKILGISIDDLEENIAWV